MNEDLAFGQNNFRLLYYRYKDSSYYVIFLVIIFIVASLIIFFQLVIPQIQNWFSIRDEVIATRDRITIMNKNVNFMNNLDKSVLDNQVQTATNALPIEKDFGSVVDALSDAAVHSGVALGDFSFLVGNVASVSGQETRIAKDLSLVKLSVSVSGNFDNVQDFLKKIDEELPLAEVTDVDGDTTSTTITLQFYQKEFPHIVFQDDAPLPSVSDADAALLDKMSAWQPSISQEDTSSSNSALPLF